ncbi:MAG TPA: PDZ domain-containing protein [Candidatus Dormibacteraeota bacterium]|nr:PDZ domain-containing protein [Candidatus Dormibacteraeota bacterium]
MSRTPVVLATLLLLAAAPASAARPAPPPSPASGETPSTPRPAPRAPRDHMIFMSSEGSWLGVSIADITSERAKELGMKEETGAEVTSVMPGSPAEEAGLQKKDVILEYQGTRIEGAMQLTRMVRETPPGRTVTVKTLRDGETRVVKVKVAEHDGEEHGGMFHRRIEIPPIEMPDIDLPDIPFLGSVPSSSRLGVSVENLGDQLGEYFGVKSGDGVLVRSVKKGSPAESAGLRAGDVIVKVDGERISDAADLRSLLRGHRGKAFPISIVRDRREQNVTVTLPKPEEPPEEEQEESRSRDPQRERHQKQADLAALIQERVRSRMDQARARLEAAQAELEARSGAADDDI